MRQDPVLKLNQKPHSAFGIAAFILALVAFVLALMAVVMSAGLEGNMYNRRLAIGILEWISAMLTLAGLSVAIIGEGAKDREKLFAHISLLLHVIGLIYHSMVVWHGFVI